MKLLSFALGIVTLLGTGAPAFAQYPSFGRSGSPTVSPYLDLLPRNSQNRGPAFNYYRRFRPAIDIQRNEQRLTQSINSLRRDVTDLQQPEQKSNSYLGTTGHPTSFHNLGGYFSSPRSRR